MSRQGPLHIKSLKREKKRVALGIALKGLMGKAYIESSDVAQSNTSQQALKNSFADSSTFG
jgi:hypothetical protein